MRIAHLINAHRNFGQLERLVDRLSHDSAACFIHVDRKVPAAEAAALAASLSRYGVQFVTARVEVTWGGYSQVRAILNGLRAVVASGYPADYINLLSGQDYPLQRTDALLRFLEGCRGDEFMECRELSRYGTGTELYRYQRYHLKETIVVSSTLRRWVERWVNRLLPRRSAPLDYTVYAGSSWWSVTTGCAGYILDFLERNPGYARFFATTHSADEMFFQTIVLNSPFGKRVRNTNLRYLDWSEHGKSPKTLTIEDYQPLLSSGKFFARKFDTDIDAVILEMLDRQLGMSGR